MGSSFIVLMSRKESDCSAVWEELSKKLGGVDVLVNNAAIQPPSSYVRVEDVTHEMVQRMVGINFQGYLYMAKHALKVMRQQQAGVVVNISSGQGHRTARQVPIYGPIKAANILQAMQWAVEYAREGIRVVSVSPGAIDTPLVRESRGPRWRSGTRQSTSGRIGRPERDRPCSPLAH